jgi:hypothetical protein
MLNQICSPDDPVAKGEHKHVCPKCNTCWKHREGEALASCDAFDEGHTCPSCGQTEVTKKFIDDKQLDEIINELFSLFGGRNRR